MRQCHVVVLLAVLCAPATLFAAPVIDTARRVAAPGSTVLTLPTGDRLLALAAAPDDTAPQPIVRPGSDRGPRRAVLSSLHAVTGVVQTYDGMLTMRVLQAGGTETNPLVKPVAGNEGAMLGVKVAAAVATVIGSETLWHNNHRLGAILASAVANSAMAMIAHHNARVLARLEGR